MKCSSPKPHFRWTAMALLGVLGLAGIPHEAGAFQFNNGDLVLAIYGNTQPIPPGQTIPPPNPEFYYDVGTASTLLAPGAQNTFNVAGLTGSPFAPASNVVGGPQTQWDLLGQFTDPNASPASTGVFTFTGSQNNAAGIALTPAVGSTSTRLATWNSALLSSTGATPSGPGGSTFLLNTDPAAFTNSNNFGLGKTLGGTWPSGGMQGSLDQTLYMIQGQARNGSQLNVISDTGSAILSATGILSICGGAGCTVAAVPVPAAVILFGTGLIGLAGIARKTRTSGMS